MKKYFAIVGLIVIVFTIKGVLQLDPDFGWHIRTGNYILVNGIPHIDPFSYSLPNYPFVAYSWLSDILMALSIPILGKIGDAFIFAVLTILSLLILLPLKKSSASLIILLLVSFSLLLFTGIRIQVISWLFFSIVLKLSLDKYLWERWKYTLPFVFLIWANMHAAFPFGLLTLAVLKGNSLLKETKIRNSALLIFSLCIGATLITPFGLALWKELWLISSSNLLHFTIPEWLPAVFLPNIVLWLYLCLSTAIVLKYRNLFPLPQLVLYSILLLSGLWSIRHLPFWLIFSFPLTIRAITALSHDSKQIKRDKIPHIKKVLLAVLTLLIISQLVLSLRDATTMSENNYYPHQAVEFLKKHNSKKIFTYYRWGGYLISHIPNTKIYMDGRMVHWQYPQCLKGNSCYIFNEYRSVLNQTSSLTEFLKRDGVTTVLLSRKSERNNDIVFRFLDTWDRAQFQKQNMNLLPTLESQLEIDHFQKIYQDNISIIYEKQI